MIHPRALAIASFAVLFSLNSAAPLSAQFTTIYNVPPDTLPIVNGRPHVTTSDTQLNLLDGGEIDDLLLVGLANTSNVEVNVLGGSALEIWTESTAVSMNITGGSLRFRTLGPLHISGGQVTPFSRANHGMLMAGGTIGDSFEMGPSSEPYVFTGGTIDAFAEIILGTLHMSGGSLGNDFRADRATEISISGGTVGENFFAVGSDLVTTKIFITGGNIGQNFRASVNTDVSIAGGTFADQMRSVRHLRGGDFRLGGVPIDGLDASGDEVVVDATSFGSFLTGTLEDGTPFAFSIDDGDSSSGFSDQLLQVTLHRTELPPIVPFRTASAATGPLLGVRGGEELLVDVPLGDHFNAGRGSVVEVVPGGSIGENFEAVAAAVLVAGGTVGPGQALEGSTFTVIDGQLVRLNVSHDSVVDVHGGTVVGLHGAGHANLYGGSVAFAESPPNTPFVLPALKSVHFFGSEFSLDGQPLAGLAPGVPYNVDVFAALKISGILADGTPFSHALGSSLSPLRRFEVLTVTVVPEPGTIMLLAVTLVPAAITRRRPANSAQA